MELKRCCFFALMCSAIFVALEGLAIPPTPPSECGTCDPSLCSAAPTACPLGTVLDACNCCEVCAKTLGERCGQSLGSCGEGLNCTADSEEEPLTCQEQTCIYEDTVLRYGDRIFLNQCSVCECTSDGLSCRSQTCPQIECINNERRITPPGGCCPVCVEFEAYYVTQSTEVTEIATEITDPVDTTTSTSEAPATIPTSVPCTQQGSFRNPQDPCETCRCIRGVQNCTRLEFLCPVGIPFDTTQAPETVEATQATEITDFTTEASEATEVTDFITEASEATEVTDITTETTETFETTNLSETTTATATPVVEPTFACTDPRPYRNPENPCEICRCVRGFPICAHADYLCPVGIPFNPVEATETTEETTQTTDATDFSTTTTAAPTPAVDPTFACTEPRPYRNPENPCEICRCVRGFPICAHADYLCPVGEPFTTFETEATSPTVTRSATNDVLLTLTTVEVALVLNVPFSDYVTNPSALTDVVSEVLKFQGADISSVQASADSNTDRTRLVLVVRISDNLLLNTLEVLMSEALHSTLVSIHITELAPATTSTDGLDVQEESRAHLFLISTITIAVICGIVAGLVLTALCFLRKRNHQDIVLPQKTETV